MSISHRHIQVFRAVMTTGSVTSAAEMLFTSQPTISRELGQLEYLLGFPLFDRVRGRLRPTARALTLYDDVQRSYIGLDRILATAANLKACEQGAQEALIGEIQIDLARFVLNLDNQLVLATATSPLPHFQIGLPGTCA